MSRPWLPAPTGSAWGDRDAARSAATIATASVPRSRLLGIAGLLPYARHQAGAGEACHLVQLAVKIMGHSQGELLVPFSRRGVAE
jgi:hypothetical protein